jgi:uncharacterized damage-inducible protein DinB
MTAQEARTHIRYSGWASRKVLEAALALSPEDRAKPMSVSHESIAKTLTHIYFADAIWYSRIADPNYPVPSHDALPSLDFVVQEWPRLQAKWEAWADPIGTMAAAVIPACPTYAHRYLLTSLLINSDSLTTNHR